MNDMKSSQTLVLCNVSNPLCLSESHRTKAKSVYFGMTEYPIHLQKMQIFLLLKI